MVDHRSCTWTGASGNKYIYDVYPRHPALSLNEPCNFIYAKLDEDRKWLPIYIGHGSLPQRADENPKVVACIDARGATHVHVHMVADRKARLAEENDLLENYPVALSPDGCNETETH